MARINLLPWRADRRSQRPATIATSSWLSARASARCTDSSPPEGSTSFASTSTSEAA